MAKLRMTFSCKAAQCLAFNLRSNSKFTWGLQELGDAVAKSNYAR